MRVGLERGVRLERSSLVGPGDDLQGHGRLGGRRVAPGGVRSPRTRVTGEARVGARVGVAVRLPERDRRLALGGVDPGGQQDGEHRGHHEQHEGVAQRPLGAGRGGQGRDRRRGHRADHAGQRHPAVRPDQRERRRQQPRDRGGAGHAVGLRGHQHAQGGGEEQGRVAGDGVGQHPAQERPQGHGRAHGPAAAVAEPVQERPDQRRQDRERQHRQQQEEQDLAPRLTRRHLEEQRAGQGDRDRGVAGGAERVHLDEPRQPRRAGALRTRRAPGLDHGEAPGPTGRPRGGTDAVGGGAGPAGHAAPQASGPALRPGARDALPGVLLGVLLGVRTRRGSVLPARVGPGREGAGAVRGHGPILPRPGDTVVGHPDPRGGSLGPDPSHSAA